MPTYKNIHPNRDQVHSIKTINDDHISLKHNKTVQTYRYYDNPTELLLIDNKPYWNPILDTTTLNLANSDDLQVVKLDSDAFTVEIINSSEEIVYLFYQSDENTPHLPIPSGSSRNIKHFQHYATQLVFKASGTITENEVFVTQYKE